MRKLTVLLVVLSAARLSAQACPADLFDPIVIQADDAGALSVRLNTKTSNYFVGVPSEAADGAERQAEELLRQKTSESRQKLFAEGEGLILRITIESNDMVELTPARRREVSPSLHSYTFDAGQFAALPSTPTAIDVIVPGGRLFCGGDIVLDEAVLPVAKAFTASGNEVKITELLAVGAKPWITNFDFGTPGQDGEGDNVLAVDFDFGKSFSLRESKVVLGRGNDADWREMSGLLEFSGSFSTQEEEYFDGVQGKLGGVFRSTDIAGTPKLLRTWIVKIDAGPEATSDGDNIDYVYAARAQAIVGFAFKTLNRKYFQPFPLLGLAVETVDPNKREDGTVPANYTRAVADVFWHLYVSDNAALEIDGEVRRRLDGDDDAADKWSRRWDFTLSVMTDNAWQPFIKYSRGEESPTFEFHEEVLAGIQLKDLFGLLTGE